MNSIAEEKNTRVDFVPKIQQLGKAGATKRRKLNNGELPQYYVSCYGTPPLIVIACGNALKKIRKSQCHCSHIYDEEMQSSTALALQRLYDKKENIVIIQIIVVKYAN
ncbi:MAG: hypothetical protein IJW02_07350 [Clostridia bacterium]|nr:hypothetical protein [Clostridia bacterium]